VSQWLKCLGVKASGIAHPVTARQLVMLFRYLLRIRYLATVAVVIFALHAVGFLGLGVLRGVQAYSLLAQMPGGHGEQRPGVHVGESVDAALFGLVMLVLALGTASLFLKSPGGEEDRDLPAWMRVKSLSELKLMLWEAILATFVVSAATGFMANLPHLTWNALLLPAAILFLTVSYFLLKRTAPRH
jgi:uncharacterized membrane protein YqhA